jgi:8-oxo-dGTP diphosphatase
MSDAAFLTAYREHAAQYAKPSVTVDLCVFTVRDSLLHLLLIERREPPFAGSWALPGGFVRVGDAFDDQGESLEDAARRELVEETGVALDRTWLAQLGAYGDPFRDPRMRIISVAFHALIPADLAPVVTGGSDASDARWVPIPTLPELAFDHARIVTDAVARLRADLDRSDMAFHLVPETFTIAELRAVWEAVMGAPQDAGNFRRRFRRMVADGVVEEAPGRRQTATKPAQVYRRAGR